MSATNELVYRTELAVLIEEHGEEAIQAKVVAETIEGASPREIAAKLGVRYAVFWTWLTEDEDRYKAYQLALTGFADDMMHQTLSIADSPTDSAASDKLRVETRMKLAGKWDRTRYGEQTNVQVGGSVSLISLLASLPRGTEAIEGETTEITQLSNNPQAEDDGSKP